MGNRTPPLFGAVLLCAAAIGYASLHEPPTPDEPAGSPASAANTSAFIDSEGTVSDRQRPRECDRSRNIDTECTYQ